MGHQMGTHIKKNKSISFLDYYLYPILDISKKTRITVFFCELYNITPYSIQAAEYIKKDHLSSSQQYGRNL